MYEESYQYGLDAEVEFSRLAKLRGCSVEPATKSEQFDHVDFHLTSEEEDGKMKAMVDVKARKKVSRRDAFYQDQLIWVEFKNVSGKLGWLYGLSDFIAFETESSFVLAFRKELADWCEAHIDLDREVRSPRKALYSAYTRKGKQDLLSLIKLEDVKKLPNTAIWKK